MTSGSNNVAGIRRSLIRITPVPYITLPCYTSYHDSHIQSNGVKIRVLLVSFYID